MQCALTSPFLRASDLDGNPTFNVLIAYEDFEAGKHARKTYDFLAGNLGRGCQFTNQMWKFDVLNIPKLRDMAARDAVLADIVIISSHGGEELPGPVRAWMESWLAQKGNPVALVALFDCPSEESPKTERIRTYLADAARKAGIDFFAQPDDWPGRRNGDGPLPYQAAEMETAPCHLDTIAA
ncbi:MAG: hypothetical protein ABSH34_08635 [Verrucomicrobiota bacterium]|jgi:hypothetical protein